MIDQVVIRVQIFEGMYSRQNNQEDRLADSLARALTVHSKPVGNQQVPAFYGF
jgi:hypothetical protein